MDLSSSILSAGVKILISGKVLIEGVDIEIDKIKEKIVSRGFTVR